MKTNIKMKVNPEQSQRVQEICFENGIGWNASGTNIYHLEYKFLFVTGECLLRSNKLECFIEDKKEEVDADLFIRTNGSCEETCCTKEDLELEKKIQNLHIALNKKVKKNKNQALEISLLLKQKEELKYKLNTAGKVYNALISNNTKLKKENIDFKEDEKILLIRIDEDKKKLANETIRADKTLILLKEEREKNEILKATDINLNREIDRLNFIIKYLEDKIERIAKSL